MSATRRLLNLMVVAAVALAAGCSGGADPEAVAERAQTQLRANRVADAERSVAELERLRRPTDRDRLLRGRLAVAAGRPDGALAELELVPDESPEAPAACLLAGQVELRRARFRHAERLLREAVRLHPRPVGTDPSDPNLIQAHRELIFIYGFQLRRTELSDEFLALSRLTALRFDDLFNWGLLKNDSWEPTEAAKTLADCIAADPEDRWSRLALAENQRRMGQLDQAETTLKTLAADDPEAIAGRARIALDRGDAEAAGTLLAAGPADDPALARLRGRLA
ncbi:MAG: tetratricopeptide repeat protein, partial [Isosphaeraceae bacterium]